MGDGKESLPVCNACLGRDMLKDISSTTTVLFGGTMITTAEGSTTLCTLGRSARLRKGRSVQKLRSGRGSMLQETEGGGVFENWSVREPYMQQPVMRVPHSWWNACMWAIKVAS